MPLVADALSYHLARIQFGLNVTFHILFPSITIALAWFLLFFKWRGWMNAYFFWTKVFALCFALGVVSGVTMSFQFGTNWPGFMKTVGNIAGPLLAYEVLTAFFLEATFLGIMLFGYRRVSPWVHTMATLLVAVGTTLSAFWILALNSWMQTPTGYVVRDGVVHPDNWLAVIFNPSFAYHMVHMLLASGLTGAFLIAGVSAYRQLKGDGAGETMRALKAAVCVAALLSPLQILVGDLHGLEAVHHQPEKVAAIEAIWKTGQDVPLTLVGWPDEGAQKTDWAVELPYAGSLILTHSWHGQIQGLDAFGADHPPVAPVFWGFRVMVGVAFLMLAAAWVGAYMLVRKGLLSCWMLYAFVAMTFSGWIATEAGWYVTEIGRQPWLVYGLLKTRDAVAANVTSGMIGLSMTAYVVLYIVLVAAFVHTLFYMARKDLGKAS